MHQGPVTRRRSSMLRNFLVVIMIFGAIFLLLSFFLSRSSQSENRMEGLNMEEYCRSRFFDSFSSENSLRHIDTEEKPTSKKVEKKVERPKKVYVLTYATKRLGLPGPEVSAKALGLEIKVDLELDKKYTTHVQKMISARNHIDYLLTPKSEGGGGAYEDDILVFLDFFDSFLCCNESTIVKHLEETGKQIVTSGETGCYPNPEMKDVYHKYIPNPPSKFQYPNSGVYIGYLGALRKMHLEIDEVWGSADVCANVNGFGEPAIYGTAKDYNDQRCYTTYHVKKLEDGDTDFFGIDYEALIVSSLHEQNIDNYVFKGYDEVYNTLTGKQTCAMHGNGGAKDTVDMAFNTVFGVDKWLFERNMGHKRGTVDRLRKRDGTRVWTE